MYIFKNALRCISRAKGRNILLGIIALVVAVSCCIGLSIRQAAESTRQETAESLNVTATISFDRQAMMQEMGGGKGEAPSQGQDGFDRNEFAGMMGDFSSLSAEDYEIYAGAESVKDFYYTVTSSLNGTDSFLPVSNSSVSTGDEAASSFESSDFESFSSSDSDMFGSGKPDAMGGGRDRLMGMQSDFSVVGYSSDSAMTDFVSGVASISEGSVFEEGTESFDCIISQELATYNDVSVGDTITLENPNNEEETHNLNVVGIYTNTSSNSSSFSMMGSTSADPANAIYMSSNAVAALAEASASQAVTQTDSNTGMEFSSALTTSVDATYVLGDVDSYYAFEEEVRQLGLDENYTVSSSDLTQYESSLLPLETLSTMAGWFLLVVLLIGAVVLVVLNVFSIRERKYEIGALTAMGMPKIMVALQFLCEIFMVTITAVIIGAIIGGAVSVPVSNALLENQVAAQSSKTVQMEQNFGRGERPDSMEMPEDMDMPEEGKQGGFGGFNKIFGESGAATQYITEVNSAMNITVVLQLLAIAVLLTLVAGAVSMLFIMHYDPLRILANRD